jgi:LPPG:FO 2-phospho-L-lactate transferase
LALRDQNVVVLVGGVGGAKLALGLQMIVPPENLTIIVNTGDDFWHYGLRICPDVDTVLYTLSGRVNQTFGWGVAGDTTTTLDTLRAFGEDTWFKLGDKDIATHLLRTHMLRQGERLTNIIAHLADAMDIAPTVLPMTDIEVATIVDTEEYGELEFQTYFVRHRWQPTVKGIRYDGSETAIMTDEVQAALQNADMILLGPSNPWLSIAPILSIPDMRATLTARSIPRVAVTPIVDGDAIKGPAAKLMRELGYEVSATAVAQYYGDVLTGFVYDQRDTKFQSHGLDSVGFDTIMTTDEDKSALARNILNWILTKREAI